MTLSNSPIDESTTHWGSVWHPAQVWRVDATSVCSCQHMRQHRQQLSDTIHVLSSKLHRQILLKCAVLLMPSYNMAWLYAGSNVRQSQIWMVDTWMWARIYYILASWDMFYDYKHTFTRQGVTDNIYDSWRPFLLHRFSPVYHKSSDISIGRQQTLPIEWRMADWVGFCIKIWQDHLIGNAK